MGKCIIYRGETSLNWIVSSLSICLLHQSNILSKMSKWTFERLFILKVFLIRAHHSSFYWEEKTSFILKLIVNAASTVVDFTNILCKYFTCAKKIDCLTVFFVLLGSLRIRDALKMLVKLNPEVNLINILHTNFLYEIFSLVTFQLCNFWCQNFVQKSTR